MIADHIKNIIKDELLFADSKRDVKKVFLAADRSFRERGVPPHRRTEVLQEVRSNLKEYIDRSTDPKSTILVVEAQSIIDEMLK